ncbi:hypothetical protein TSAR_014007 [Trichomalopsis sarcophagae]|uniref:Uncharacterized protein n=1 Tax=Trichomalopsis sarcophagae TaxID=543379 RepID=A0A232EFA5_9HYME|nr:hypothetical protein TSAR_014007 [Trichomalopsis sarcophagae]
MALNYCEFVTERFVTREKDLKKRLGVATPPGATERTSEVSVEVIFLNERFEVRSPRESGVEGDSKEFHFSYTNDDRGGAVDVVAWYLYSLEFESEYDNVFTITLKRKN